MKKQSRVILGIDPGIADTGYGVIGDESGSLRCLDYGSIKTKAGLPLPDRLLTLAQEIDRIFAKYQPAVVAVEQLFFCRNVKTALIVGQARGVVLLKVREHNLPIMEFTPMQIKQAVAAYGGAGKMQVQKMVKLMLNMKELPRPDDAADALAAAICATNSSNFVY